MYYPFLSLHDSSAIYICVRVQFIYSCLNCCIIRVQGTTSFQHSAPGDKLSDSWKQGMESRMDFLQNNLTELLQLIKGGAACNRAPTVPTEEIPPTVSTGVHETDEDPPGCNSLAQAVPEDLFRPSPGKKYLLHFLILFHCVA